MKKKRISLKTDRRTILAGRRYGALILTVLACAALTCPALAADDPLTIVGNLSDFVFSIIKALGVIILGWGIVQMGMSIQSHDASQRTQGFLCLFGGLMIAFAKEILTAIGAV
ncbi:glutamyl-tRNA amidotransferase [Neopoerus faecalis]|uniref:glutamyl-tRNA amidotransferase n=1 Tax=Neopoerus faecalis TaxID=3032125 RepID=UPI003306B8E2